MECRSTRPLSTVFGLTSQPDWQEHYDITVYQEGWRMGGKCASVRDPAKSNRIEEHGLHIFFGFYDNAIKMMREAYEELERPVTAPMATFDAAFKPHSFIAIQEYINKKWVDWPIFFPTNDKVPGSDDNYKNDFLDSPAGMVKWLFQNIGEQLKSCEHLKTYSAPRPRSTTERLSALVGHPFGDHHVVDDIVKIAEKIVEHVVNTIEKDLVKLEKLEGNISELIEHAIATFEQLFGPTAGTLTSIRQLLLAVKFGLYVAKSMTWRLFVYGWKEIDNLDFRDWLHQNDAPKDVYCSVITRSFYDLYLAYPKGDTINSLCGGNLAAGTLLHAYYLACAQYKGAIFWKMQAGMGESVVVPLYQALAKRGVKFEFFSRVSNLGLSIDKSEIGSIKIDVQARLSKTRAFGDIQFTSF